MLVDWMLPDMSGLELTRALKRDRETRDLPVIMLTARAEEGDKVAGLEGGADDYVTKPFSPRELLARINAVLRRAGAGATATSARGRTGWRSTAPATASARASARCALGPTEYRMLEFFMTHPERVYSREQLLDRVWGGNVYVEERTIDVHIRRLRKALEEFGYDRLVQTVRGTRLPLLGRGRRCRDERPRHWLVPAGGCACSRVLASALLGWLAGRPRGSASRVALALAAVPGSC